MEHNMKIIRPFSLLLLSLFLMGVSGGCATLPKVSEVIQEAPATETPQILSAKGLLSPQQSKVLIERLKRSLEPMDLLDLQIAVIESVSGSPLIIGNKVRLLIDGLATYAAMFEAVENAKDSINIETFIFEDDETGRTFADLLLKKQTEGVQVNIIYDSVGSYSTPRTFFKRLQDAGIQVLEFNPVNPFKALGRFQLIHRDHRKILVVDGKVAIMGGVNISQVYSGSLSGREPEEGKRSWRRNPLA